MNSAFAPIADQVLAYNPLGLMYGKAEHPKVDVKVSRREYLVCAKCPLPTCNELSVLCAYHLDAPERKQTQVERNRARRALGRPKKEVLGE